MHFTWRNIHSQGLIDLHDVWKLDLVADILLGYEIKGTLDVRRTSRDIVINSSLDSELSIHLNNGIAWAINQGQVSYILLVFYWIRQKSQDHVPYYRKLTLHEIKPGIGN